MERFDYSFTPSRGPSRTDAARQGPEAVAITNAGEYVAPSRHRVEIAADVARAVAGTVDFRPEVEIAVAPVSSPARTRVSVVNGTSFASARELATRTGRAPLVLNFASAKNPGGGFLGGARAQEESLARSSALYACIKDSAMYAHHRARTDCMYTSWMIHSPSVPVFRDDDTGELLEVPYLASILTAPAPNAGVVESRQQHRREEVRRVMAERVRRVLAICVQKGERELVLGAWGCGVFKNDPDVVARAFAKELAGDFAGAFDEVVFAVLDWSEERRFVRPFVEHLLP